MEPAPDTDSVTHFGDAAVWTGVRDDDREAWLAMRRDVITASDVAAVLGEGEYEGQDAFSVYVEKTTIKLDRPEPNIHSRLFWGKVLEQPVLTAVAAYYGWEYQRGGALLRNRKRPWLGCTLDAEIRRDPVLNDWEPLEGKTSVLTKLWDEEEEKMPLTYMLQVESQLATVERPRAPIFAFLQGRGDPACLINVESVPELRALIYEKTEEFMHHVKRLEPPPVSELSESALRRLYPVDNGQLVTLPAEACEWTREWKEVKKVIADAVDRKKLLENRLREAIGDAWCAALPEAIEGVAYWKNALEKRAGYTTTVNPSEGRVLRPLKNEPKQEAGPKTVVMRATPENDIERALEASLEPAPPIIFAKGRRRR